MSEPKESTVGQTHTHKRTVALARPFLHGAIRCGALTAAGGGAFLKARCGLQPPTRPPAGAASFAYTVAPAPPPSSRPEMQAVRSSAGAPTRLVVGYDCRTYVVAGGTRPVACAQIKNRGAGNVLAHVHTVGEIRPSEWRDGPTDECTRVSEQPHSQQPPMCPA